MPISRKQPNISEHHVHRTISNFERVQAISARKRLILSQMSRNYYHETVSHQKRQCFVEKCVSTDPPLYCPHGTTAKLLRNISLVCFKPHRKLSDLTNRNTVCHNSRTPNTNISVPDIVSYACLNAYQR